MPFASEHDFHQPVAPITLLPRGGDESWSMSYYSKRRPNEMIGGFHGLGSVEMDELNRLPPKLVEYLADEAQDPAFVRDYLIDALHSGNPHAKIVNDIAKAAYAYSSGDPGMGDLGKSFFKKIAKVVRKVHKAITPKFMQKIEGKIHAVERKVWKKYGNVLISVAGAVLAPFTGGASMVAAAIILAGKGLYEKRKAAIEAKKAAKADAAQIDAAASAAEAQVAADVDKFYNDNQAWFLQYDMTPVKWRQLTLQQKLDFINAGVAGTMPVSTPIPPPPPDVVAAQTAQTAQAAANAGIPPALVQPPGFAPGTGYSTSGGGAPMEVPPPPPGTQGGSFESIIEGKSAGVFGTLDEAYQTILGMTKPGDRFEIIANGKSMGLGVRTEDGAVEVPPEAEAKMKSLTHEQSQAIVQEAEKTAPSGGIPWLLILGGGAAAVLASR